MQKKYPNESNYAFVSGNPILYADKAGLDKIVMITTIGKDGKVTQIRSVDKDYFLYYHDNAYSGMGYFMKADVVQNYIVDLRKDGAEQLSYTYEIANRKEISALEYLGGKATNNLKTISGYGQGGIKEYGFRIVGSNYDAPWDAGLPKAKESDALYLRDWLDMVGGFRESETPKDLWQATINHFRSKGGKIGNGAKQIEEAAQYITNISSNLIEEVNVVEKIKERLDQKSHKYERIANPIILYDLPDRFQPYVDTPIILSRQNPASPGNDSTIKQPIRHERKRK